MSHVTHQAHQALNGIGRILFRREIICAALPLWMQIPALWLATTARLSGLQTAETAGPFRPAAQHKICGQFYSQMQIMGRLLVKVARFSGPQIAETSGLPRQAVPVFNYVGSPSRVQITGRLLVKLAPFSELQTAETAGLLNRAESRTTFSEFLLPMRTPEVRWVGHLARVRSLEQRTEENTGSVSQTQGRCSFSMSRSRTQTLERPLVMGAQFSERRMEVTSGRLKQAEPQRHCTAFRSPTRITGRLPASS